MPHSIKRILVIKMFYPMVKAVAARNIHVTVLGFESGVEPQAEAQILQSLPQNVKFLPLQFQRRSRTLGNLKLIGRFARVIKEEQPDIIHVNALQDLILAFIAAQIALPLKRKPPIVVMTHNPEIWSDLKRARLASRTIRMFADGFVALATTNLKQVVSMGFPEKRVIVIPNPFDPEQVKNGVPPQENPSGPAEKNVRVIYIANICERKAQDVLVRAAARVLKKHPNVVFDLLGKPLHSEDGYVEKVVALARELNVQQQVIFHGLVPFQEAMERLDQSDIFVFPTLSEMMPRAVIEAMMAGKPIIASAVDGILDLIENQKNGILVQPGDEEELANAICELIENPSQASALGSASREYVMSFCSPERIGGLFEGFYRSLVE
jgi:glycosyltransferase involved in cell wall biosynthesis